MPMIAYTSQKPDGLYDPLVLQATLQERDLEVTDDLVVIRKEDAGAYIEAQRTGQPAVSGPGATGTLTHVNPKVRVSRAKIGEMRVALRELGMSEDVEFLKEPEA